jgi:hypothetical protein
MICKFNESATQQDSPPVNHQNSKIETKIRRVLKDDAAQPVKDGMRIDALTQLPVATTYMSVPNAPTQTTLPTVVTPQVRSESQRLCICWER